MADDGDGDGIAPSIGAFVQVAGFAVGAPAITLFGALNLDEVEGAS